MGKQWKQWQTLFWGDSKITADDDCSQEIERLFLLGRKAMTNLDSILKSRDITLSTKVHLVKAMFFSSGHVWMWELEYKESWAPKDWTVVLNFWTVVLKKTLESPLDRMRSNQSILKEISPEYSLEGLMLKLVLWPSDAKNWLIGKALDAGKDRMREEKGMAEDDMVGWHYRLMSKRVWVSSRSWWWAGKPGVLQSVGSQIVRHNWVTELNWFHICYGSKAPQL